MACRSPKREMLSSSKAGTWPKGCYIERISQKREPEREREGQREKRTWILRKSGFLCSPLDILTFLSWKSTSFSSKQAKTLDTAVDIGGPYTFTGAAIVDPYGLRIVEFDNPFGFEMQVSFVFCCQPYKGVGFTLFYRFLGSDEEERAGREMLFTFSIFLKLKGVNSLK